MTLDEAIARGVYHLGEDPQARTAGHLRSILTMLEDAGICRFDPPARPRTLWLKTLPSETTLPVYVPRKVQVELTEIITALKGAGYKVERA